METDERAEFFSLSGFIFNISMSNLCVYKVLQTVAGYDIVYTQHEQLSAPQLLIVDLTSQLSRGSLHFWYYPDGFDFRFFFLSPFSFAFITSKEEGQ